MSRKLLESHKAIIEQACNALSEGTVSKDQCIQQILFAFEDPKDAMQNIVDISTSVLGAIAELIKYIKQFKTNVKIGHNIKVEFFKHFQHCLRLLLNSKVEEQKRMVYEYNYWSKQVVEPMLQIHDHKWFFENIDYFVQQKQFFVFSPYHLTLAEKLCSRETCYLIKNYVYKNGYETDLFIINDRNIRLSVLDAFQNPDVTDKQLIDRFSTGVFCWKPEFWEKITGSGFKYTYEAGCTPNCDIQRKELFEFAVKQGYSLCSEIRDKDDCGTPLYWITVRGGLEWIKFVKENYPMQLESDWFGSSIVAACCAKNDRDDLLLYLLNECKAPTMHYWGAAYYALLERNYKCFQVCVEHKLPMKYKMLNEIIQTITSKLEPQEVVEFFETRPAVIKRLFQARPDFQDRAQCCPISTHYLSWFPKDYENNLVKYVINPLNVHISGVDWRKTIKQTVQDYKVVLNNPDYINIAAYHKNWPVVELLIELGFFANIAELSSFLPDADTKQNQECCKDHQDPNFRISKETKDVLFFFGRG
jgi:hypothetical protein